jgi:C1A family cysteine protease
MNKKMISILICTLVIIAVLPKVSSINKLHADQITNDSRIDDDCDCTQENKNSIYQEYAVMENPPNPLDIGVNSPKPIPMSTPNEFSWANNNDKDWTTPAKQQGNCGSCWAFAAMSSFESVIKIKEDCAKLNPDFSEQYILSCLSSAGSCYGGSAYRALQYIKETTSEGNYVNGVPPEPCFLYEADDDIPCSEKCPNWEEQLVPLLGYSSWKPDGTPSDIESIKTQIMEDGPVIAHMKATDPFKLWGSLNDNPDSYYPDYRKVYGINHVIIIVGWKDVSSIPNGGYWICKNSWGPHWGYNGFFNIEYNGLNIDTTTIISTDYDPDSVSWPPIIDTGGSYGTILGQVTTFDASGSEAVEGEITEYEWDFGDDATGSGVITTHTYEELGEYTVTLTITDSDNNEVTETTSIWIQVSNEAPGIPTITGQTPGGVGRAYDYTFSSTDPDENDVWYTVDWGDDTSQVSIGPFGSGEDKTLRHRWAWLGTYTIQVKAIDVFGEESDWGTLSVTMPRTREASRGIFSRFIERLIDTFPILARLW